MSDEIKTRITVDAQDAIESASKLQKNWQDIAQKAQSILKPAMYELIGNFQKLALEQAHADEALKKFTITNERWAQRVGVGAKAVADVDQELQNFLTTLGQAVRQSEFAPGAEIATNLREVALAEAEIEEAHKNLFQTVQQEDWAQRVGASSSSAKAEVDALRDSMQKMVAVEHERRQKMAAFLDQKFTGPNRTVADLNRAAGGDVSDRDLAGLAFDKTEQGANRVGRAMEGMQLRTKRGTMALVELSRGAEDFAVSSQYGGFQAGMRASINNMSQFAFILNPMAGAIVGFAGALTAVAVPALVRYYTAVDEAAKKMETLRFNREAFLKLELGFMGGDRAGALQREIKILATTLERYAGTESAKMQWGGGAMSYLHAQYTREEAEYMNRVGKDQSASVDRRLSLEEVQQIIQRMVQAGQEGNEGSVLPAIEAQFTAERSVGRFQAKFTDEFREMLGKIEAEIRAKAYEKYLVEEEMGVEDLEEAQRQILEDQNQAEEEGLRIRQNRNQFLRDLANEQEEREVGVGKFMRQLSETLDETVREANIFKENMAWIAQNSEQLGDAALELAAILEDQRDVEQNRKDALEALQEREEALRDRDKADRGLMGTISGIEELNRRITEAAGGQGRRKDEAAEETKKLREERKNIEKEAKAQREELAQRTINVLSEIKDKLPGVAVAAP